MKFLVRLFSFFRKEFFEVLRQPKLVLTLILGPFLILLLFGVGYTNQQDPVRTLIVASEDNELAQVVTEHMSEVEETISYQGVTDSLGEMQRQLAQGRIDLGMVIPDDAAQTIRADEKVVLDFYQNQIDPNQKSYLNYVASFLTQVMNQKTLLTLAQESDIQEVTNISPEVLTEPFTYQSVSVSGSEINPREFITPGVLVLLLQHMMTTLSALSIVREQRAGTMELYRVSPLRPGEIIFSKYLIYMVIGLIIAAFLAAGNYVGLGFPMRGEWLHVLYVFLSVLFTSVGIGFMISLISKTDTEAIQLAMIALLFSVFFSGFFIDLRFLTAPVKYISYAIPASYGNRMLQDIMLRGGTIDLMQLGILLGIGVFLFLTSLLLLGRRMRQE